MKAKLVTIEQIATREKHPNADRLHIYTLEGLAWQVVSNVKYEVGDIVGFVHTDTVAPDNGKFEFLRDAKFRIKPIKLRGVRSNGMLLPTSEINDLHEHLPFGADIGEEIGFKKYHKPQPLTLGGEVAGPFPKSIVPQTDEERLQNMPQLIEALSETGAAYATIKHDGSSATFIKTEEGEFRVCSRQQELRETEKNAFWKVARKYNLAEEMVNGTVIQAELIGPKVQGNPEKVDELEIRVFNVWTLWNGKLASFPELEEWCIQLKIPMADIYGTFIGDEIPTTVEAYEALSRKVQYGPNPGEGLVWRPMYPRFNQELQTTLSFKVINDNYKD
mgnify:CR=1 FL=1